MERILILNGSPRAPKSNSKRYAEIFMKHYPYEAVYRPITSKNHLSLCEEMKNYTHVLFVFPLYADALPSGFLQFLKNLEAHPPIRKPRISILINCGFLEYEQNEVAVRMMQLFCRRNEYPLGSILMLGSGEALLDTPFKYIAHRKIRQFVQSISTGRHRTLTGTMPLSKTLFRMAADIYWTRYGKRFGTSKRQMQTLEIEK